MFPLKSDTIRDRTTIEGGMAPARLGEAPDEHFIRRVQKNDFHRMAGFTNLLQDLFTSLQIVAATDIHNQSNVPDLLFCFFDQFNKGREQRDGQIVEAKKTLILQGAYCGRFS